MLLADNMFVDMAGVFEYDLELKEKGDHRKFLTQTASFKQVCTMPQVAVWCRMILTARGVTREKTEKKKKEKD